MNKSTHSFFSFLFFLLFLFVLLEVVNNFSFFSQAKSTYHPHNMSGALKVLAYATSYFFILINLLLFLSMRRGKLFVFFIIVISTAFLLDASYYLNSLSRGFSAGEFVTAVNEIAQADHAVSSFYGGFIKSIFFLIAILLTTLVYRKLSSRRFFILPLLLLPLSFLGGNYILQHTFYRVHNYPAFVKVPLSVFNAYNDGLLSVPFTDRNAVTVDPTNPAHYKNIIFFVDESVRGDYLSVNGFAKQTTPYLETLDKLLTLGSISSVSNQSAQTNYILRNGVVMDELPDRTFSTVTKPTIFQYAKKAGFKTLFLDAQSYDLVNHMSNYDLKYIDFFENLSADKSTHNDKFHDRKMVDRLASLLKDNENNFVYFVKYGSHFQWKTTYPPDQNFFEPSMSRAEGMSFDIRNKAVNTYMNSIRWGVDSFFEYLLKTVDTKDTLIIYTADHGQNILENDLLITHGLAENPPSNMANVPLLFYTDDIEDIKSKFEKIDLDSYSQFQIFPSLLELMGYQGRL